MDVLVSILWSWVPAIILLLPPLFVLFARQVTGIDKVLWFIGVLLTSYIGLMLFLIYLKLDSRRPDQT